MRASYSVLVGLALLVPATAHADAKKEAKQHLEKATAAHSAGKLDEALKELKIAYTLDPQPALLYAIGQVHVLQGQCDQAITFYQRFIDSNPAPEQAAKANEAIETCKKLQTPDQAVDKPVDKPVENVVAPPPPVRIVTTTRPWYTDVLGDALVGTGLVAGIAGAIFYSGALSARDDADSVMSYDRYDELLSTAERKQTYALVFAASGAALITAGVISYVVRDRHVETRSVGVAPTSSGGMVTWSARF